MKNKQIHVPIENEILVPFYEYCIAHNTTMCDKIREFIKDTLEEKKDGETINRTVSEQESQNTTA